MTSPSASGVRSTPFHELAEASIRIAATRSRTEKRRVLVDLLSRVPAEEVDAAVGWLSGEPLAGHLGVGPAQLWGMSKSLAPEEPTAQLVVVEAALEEARRADPGLRPARVAALYAMLTTPERRLVAGALTGSLGQGSLGGIMILALAELGKTSEADVRRHVMLRGSLAAAARALLGPEGPDHELPSIRLFRPLAPMLATPASSIEEATLGVKLARAEWKIDGIRAQIHKDGADVRLYSRQGNDITRGCESLVPRLASLAADTLVLDGEVALVGPDGKTRPFQDSFSAIASGGAPAGSGPRLRVFLFDCLHRDGKDLVDAPLSERLDALTAVAPPDLLVASASIPSLDDARAFYRAALDAGSEGVVVKDVASPYRFGARGRAWQKVKEFTTVDLVVLAAEWGHGRRRGFLSNLHLGARTEDGAFCMVGKTFKGLTDELLRWQTTRFEEISSGRDGHVVHVRPEVVVEVRFNDVQRSPRYPGGVALRFARVVRYREDKHPDEVEPLETLVARAPVARGGTGTTRARGKRTDPAPTRQLSLFRDPD